MRGKRNPDEPLLTLYLPDGAVIGPVVRFEETGVQALLDGKIPRDDRLRFALYLRSGMITGEVTCLEQTDRLCRLQFTALTPRDRDRLQPLIEPNE